MGYCELFAARTRDINKDKVDFLYADRYAGEFSAVTARVESYGAK